MALAWKASWVQALRGSNPLSSALAKNTPLMECFLFSHHIRVEQVQLLHVSCGTARRNPNQNQLRIHLEYQIRNNVHALKL